MKFKVQLPRLSPPTIRLTPGLVVLAVFALGLAAFGYGLWLAWPPLGPIGAGAVLMAVAIFGESPKP